MIIVIDTDFLNRYKTALYMMEHNNFTDSITVTNSNIDIHGQVYTDGNASTLAISAERMRTIGH